MKMMAPLEVGICCENLDRLLDFYEQLGFERVSVIDVPAEKAAASGYRIARLQTPWGERLKLLRPASAVAAGRDQGPLLQSCGIRYLTFIIGDLGRLLIS